jgi:hypothetical protein
MMEGKMFEKVSFVRWACSVLLLAALGAMFLPTEILAAPGAAKGNLVGFIYLGDLNSPVADAVVKIRSVKDGTETKSEPTDKNGGYKLLGIEEGQYILGVSVKHGNYNLEVLIQIKGGETGKLSLVLKEGQVNAVLAKNVPKAAFFATPLGIALLAGASTAAVVTGVSMINDTTPRPASASKK